MIVTDSPAILLRLRASGKPFRIISRIYRASPGIHCRSLIGLVRYKNSVPSRDNTAASESIANRYLPTAAFLILWYGWRWVPELVPFFVAVENSPFQYRSSAVFEHLKE